jgi:hypothetical protein
MKKLWIFVTVAILALTMLFAGNAQAVNRHYYANVYKQTNEGITPIETPSAQITSGITYKVLATGANTSESLLANAGTHTTGASKTNPVTSTVFGTDGGRIEFWCDPTDSTTDLYVDLIVVDTAGGYTAFVHNFSPYMHSIVIDERPNIVHHGVIWFATTSATNFATGITFAPYTEIENVVVQVVTTDSGHTISVGTSDTAAGFRTGVSMTSAGFIADTAVITNGSNIDYVPATTYGTLLATAITGSDAVATVGGITRKTYFVTTVGTDDDLEYTGGASASTGAGYIHFWFVRLR